MSPFDEFIMELILSGFLFTDDSIDFANQLSGPVCLILSILSFFIIKSWVVDHNLEGIECLLLPFGLGSSLLDLSFEGLNCLADSNLIITGTLKVHDSELFVVVISFGLQLKDCIVKGNELHLTIYSLCGSNG